MSKLPLFKSYSEEVKLLEASVRQLAEHHDKLSILEAGCGPGWPLDLTGLSYRLTGIDLDAAALARRTDVAKDLDEAIVGDLRQVEFGNRQFDVIYNAFVLEHVREADTVLTNFARWLKPGGLLLLLLPDRSSVFGYITRITPFWFHIFYHRYILGKKDAGQPGYGPYPTYYHPAVSRSGIREFCKSHGFEIQEERGSCTYDLNRDLRSTLVRLVAQTVSALSLGQLPWRHNNLTYVLRKKVANPG